MSNLSKNIISKDGATNDLEKLVANMTGSHIPEEQTSGLGKELKKILPGAGGLLPKYDHLEVGKVLGVKYERVNVTLFDCMIPDKDVYISVGKGSNSYHGTYSGFKAYQPSVVDDCKIIIGIGLPMRCKYRQNLDGSPYALYGQPHAINYLFNSDGSYSIINGEDSETVVHPTRIRVTACINIPTAVWRDESELPIPSPTDAGKALLVNNQGNAYVLGDWPNELPTPTVQDEDKLVGVNSSGTYALVNDRLPESTVQDEGKLVGVNNSGAYILRNNYTPDPQTVTIGLVEHEATVHNILVGTAELEDGVSDLPTGVIYLQIEE